MKREDLRNIAIIAHVDHGKTTLVDQMLRQGGAFKSHQVVSDRVMDNGDLEKERGITILAKNTSCRYGDVKINIVDTPGHADFGGEVERVLKMVDGAVLLVDAAEGPMPQTRFVLSKALELGHRIIVVINKVDRPDARPYEVVDECLELLLDLDASEEQLDSPIVFCSGREGKAGLSPEKLEDTLEVLFTKVLDQIPAPEGDDEGPLQLLVSAIDYNEYVGRIAIGRIERGVMEEGKEIIVADYHGNHAPYKSKATNIYEIEGLGRTSVKSAKVGDIVCFSGAESITIGDTVCSPEDPTPLRFIKISAPTVQMTFSVNDSPFAGREGKLVTSRHIRERLQKELLKDVSLLVEDGETSESFLISGRGEMHLSILIETMRREGYELQVSTPRVLYKTENGVKLEPMEQLLVDVPEESVGAVIEKISSRKGELKNMSPSGSRMRVEFLIPARGLFGYRSEFMTDTKGEGILNTLFDGYAEYKGDIPFRQYGSLVAFETGEAVAYGLFNAQDRGSLFIDPGTPVYEGMVVGSSPKNEDIAVNICKKKHVTNMRASGSDDALRLIPPKRMSLEESLEFLGEDELLEVTPLSLRIRKRILDNGMRMKSANKKNK